MDNSRQLPSFNEFVSATQRQTSQNILEDGQQQLIRSQIQIAQALANIVCVNKILYKYYIQICQLSNDIREVEIETRKYLEVLRTQIANVRISRTTYP